MLDKNKILQCCTNDIKTNGTSSSSRQPLFFVKSAEDSVDGPRLAG